MRRTRRASSALAAGVLLLGVVTLGAWVLPELLGRYRHLYEMKANTALALACGAASNLIRVGSSSLARSMRPLGRGLESIVALVGAVTLAQFVLGTDLGVDGLLARAVGLPTRMGLLTAVGLVSIGAAMLLRDRPGRWTPAASEASAIVAAAVALASIFGHVFGLRDLYSLLQTAMSMQTGVGLLGLAVAVLLAEPERGIVATVVSQGSGGYLARRLIPIILVVPIALGWLSVQGARAGLYDEAMGGSIDILLAIFVMLGAVVVGARAVNHLDLERRLGEARIVELNARLTRHTRELEEMNRELESFSYSISHDLRAPLRHIAGFAELLDKRAGGTLDEQGRHYLRTISDAARRGGQLVDDLLAFSRMSRAEMKLGLVDMERCFADAWRDLAPDRDRRHVDFAVDALPSVKGDAALLRVVAQNLLSNALKYTRPRDPAVIRVSARDGADAVTFVVCDNGVGFDMRYVGKLFGVFQRLHSAEAFEGVGIGLANVQRIVQRHGGRVWAEGETDRGATFYFTLPKGETA